MKKAIEHAAAVIRKAVESNDSVLIRHHDDTDGYAAGYIFEKAIEKLGARYITRVASRTPFYDYGDCLRDVNANLRHSNDTLVIITDLGSNDQSLEALQKWQEFAATIVIADHHEFDEENKKLVDAYVNPLDHSMPSDYSAAMVAYLIAQELGGPVMDHVAALAMTADKSSGEIYDRFLKRSGISHEKLKDWSLFTDHECYHARFTLSTPYLEHIFDKERLVQHVGKAAAIRSQLDAIAKAISRYIKEKKCNDIKLLLLSKDAVSMYSYASSKLVRLAHESRNGKHVTMTHNDHSLSIRSSDERFSVHDLLAYLKRELPFAQISGGGHKMAGGIHFIPLAQKDVMAKTREFLATL